MIVEEGSVEAQVFAFEETYRSHVTESAPIPVEGFGSIEAEFKRLGEEFCYGKITNDEFVDPWFVEALLTVGK